MNWDKYISQLREGSLYKTCGVVSKVSASAIHAIGVAGRVGDLCKIHSAEGDDQFTYAQIVSQDLGNAVLMPLGDVVGITIGAEVECNNTPLKIKVGMDLLGQVVDAFGHSLSNQFSTSQMIEIEVKGKIVNPLARKKINNQFVTGIRAVDTFLPIGQGQRIGIFAGSGVGKSSLLGMMAKNASSDVNVIALIGERGREVNDFISQVLGQAGMEKSVVVVATADQPPMLRELAVHTANSIAEYFSDHQLNVLLIMDSITRFAMARREIGLLTGEPATSRGYTPTTFSELPKIVERAGNFTDRGSITGIYTVLVEGDDLNEPISDHMRSILDGHIVLSRELANEQHYPAIDLLKSTSRVAHDLWESNEKELVKSALKMIGVRERNRDVVEVGVYKAGSNPELDKVLAVYPKIRSFLSQEINEAKDQPKESFKHLQAVIN